MKKQKTHNKNHKDKKYVGVAPLGDPQKRNTQRGITLIALIITIIVLLILAVVSIRLVMNNGILGKAENATTAYGTAEEKEQIKIGYADYQMAQASGEANPTLTVAGAKSITGDATTGWTVEFTKTRNIYTVTQDGVITDITTEDTGGGATTFNPETLTIGTAINTDKYGWKVTNYNIEETETGGWRLFFQDNNYTYLISNNCVAGEDISCYRGSYPNGSFVSTVGQKLNPMLLNNGTFVESNTSSNLITTAWLTDVSDTARWAKYKNNDAVFAIRKSNCRIICCII